MIQHLYDWEKYYHFDRPDPLVQLAIIHAQFELIHPFLDGNGRLERMMPEGSETCICLCRKVYQGSGKDSQAAFEKDGKHGKDIRLKLG
jgi:hypothetical protein